jgi:phosphatidylglycerophosphatase A
MMIKQPLWTKVLSDTVIVNLATLGPVGQFKAPGTWGSLAGLIWYTLFYYNISVIGAVLFTVGFLYFALAICGEAEIRLRKVDPGEIILDEFVAMPICFIGLQPYIASSWAWAVFLAAFVLFRFFDIVKPFGIKNLQRYPGGMGVVLDDVAAALATCLVLNIFFRLLL